MAKKYQFYIQKGFRFRLTRTDGDHTCWKREEIWRELISIHKGFPHLERTLRKDCGLSVHISLFSSSCDSNNDLSLLLDRFYDASQEPQAYICLSWDGLPDRKPITESEKSLDLENDVHFSVTGTVDIHRIQLSDEKRKRFRNVMRLLELSPFLAWHQILRVDSSIATRDLSANYGFETHLKAVWDRLQEDEQREWPRLMHLTSTTKVKQP